MYNQQLHYFNYRFKDETLRKVFEEVFFKQDFHGLFTDAELLGVTINVGYNEAKSFIYEFSKGYTSQQISSEFSKEFSKMIEGKSGGSARLRNMEEVKSLYENARADKPEILSAGNVLRKTLYLANGKNLTSYVSQLNKVIERFKKETRNEWNVAWYADFKGV